MRLISRQVKTTESGKQIMATLNVFINCTCGLLPSRSSSYAIVMHYNGYVLFVAGALREAMAEELGLTPSGFVPTFESKLSNRLTTYINYTSERFGEYDE